MRILTFLFSEQRFDRRDAVLARVLSIMECLTVFMCTRVCHTSVLYQNCSS